MRQNEINTRPRLVIFGDDWGRHPSTIQHLTRGLQERYDVDWVNTIGTRRPRLTPADAKRGFEKLCSWLAAPEGAPQPSNEILRIHSPIHWPSFRHPWERRFNRVLLLRALHDVLRSAPTPTSVITTTAITADLAAAHPDLNWVYFCMDDFPAWPDLDSSTLQQMEVELLRFMRSIVVVSDNLRERFHSMGFRSSLVTAGVDLSMWRGIVRKPLPRSGTRPIATFWGSADPRLDTEVCEAIAEKCELVMVGPRARVASSLLRHPSVHWRGSVPHTQLPLVASETDVLVMPYAPMAATHAMQPLKMKEYLATGLPVVATPLPATKAWADAMDLVADPSEFAARVVERARTPLPSAQVLARQRLKDEAWEAKSTALEQFFLKASSLYES